MTIQTEIVSWAATRPGWQQEALFDLAAGKQWGDSELGDLVSEIEHGRPAKRKLSEADIPVATSSSSTVSLTSIRDLKNVNALVPAQDLNLADVGLTVVYGDNGSGKSGYARLIKSAVRSLHHEEVHGNVFATEQQPQHAEIHYRSGAGDRRVSWPTQGTDELSAVSFYDEACGDAYLEKESELGYRPSALVILDGLIELCDRLKGRLDSELNANGLEADPPPDVPDGTEAEKFLASLSGRTTEAELDKACALSPDADADLNRLRQEEARLRGSSPSLEIGRLTALAEKTRVVEQRVTDFEEKVSTKAAEEVTAAVENARTAREAARVASAASFDAEPLDGVGSDAWRELWAAAREFSKADAYPGRPFPVLDDDAVCVLCQQGLSPAGVDRLRRFDAFVQDTTAKKAEEAEKRVATLTSALQALAVESANLGVAFAAVRAEDEELGGEVAQWLESCETRRRGLLDQLAGESTTELPHLDASPQTLLETASNAFDADAASIDEEQFNESLRKAVDARKEIEGHKTLLTHRSRLAKEISRRKRREELEAARRETDTKGITRKATELTEKYVTEEVRDRFTRETDRLHLERIHLASAGGQKGRLRQRPELLGASETRPVREVLSEGEQTALGLAGFFTEAYFDRTASAIVLDDPVSSLDHIRRRNVAKRLAELAVDRQVVVFTHDLEFVVALSAAAMAVGADFTERAIERRGTDPGVCVDEHPWKAKDVGRRISELDRSLAEIKRGRTEWGQQEYEQRCADWAGKISETWERVLHLEIAQQIFDLGSSEVRPKMLKVIARVTPQDEQKFQSSYSRVSEWARRHDKSHLEIWSHPSQPNFRKSWKQ